MGGRETAQIMDCATQKEGLCVPFIHFPDVHGTFLCTVTEAIEQDTRDPCFYGLYALVWKTGTKPVKEPMDQRAAERVRCFEEHN